MANMFEFYLDLDGGDEGAHIQLKAPNNMSDSDLLRFLSLAMVSRRRGDKQVPFDGDEYMARLADVSRLLTGVETLVQEELREEFGLYQAIDVMAKLNFLKAEGVKPTLWETIKRKASKANWSAIFLAIVFISGLAASEIINVWTK
jgi:hypothetical protein